MSTTSLRILVPRGLATTRLEKIFDSITYIKTIWADEFLNALKHYQTQAKKWDHIITDDTIFKKFIVFLAVSPCHMGFVGSFPAVPPSEVNLLYA